ncbi:MAG: ribonuclease III domain-containing protein [Cyanobacteria bacterium J06632_22]
MIGGLQPTLTAVQLQSLSPVALAYIGDAAYELYVRSQLLWPPLGSQDYHHAVVAQVRAEQQADYIRQLMPRLTEIEQDWVRRGRNASPRRHRRASAYQQATGFETLLGYLYLTDVDRLTQLLDSLNLGSRCPATEVES